MAINQARQNLAKAIIARTPKPAANGGTTAPKAAKGIGSANALRTSPSGLVKPKGFTNEFGLYKAGQASPVASTAAGTSAAPAASGATPWDSKYEQSVTGAQKKYANELSNIDLGEEATKQEYGLEPGFNDYKANPYSRAALLEKSYETANRGTTNSAGLQLYSGSTSNKLGANRSTRDQNYNTLQSDLATNLGEYTTGRAKAKEEEAETEQEAYWNRVRDAEEHEPEAEASPSGSPSQTKKPKVAKKPTSSRANITKNAIANNKKAK